MTADEHIEETLNRAGQTISDLPRSFAGGPEAYGDEPRKNALCAAWSWYLPAVISAGEAVDFMQNRRNETVMVQYILHLSEVVDRYDEALTRLCDLRDRHVHIVGNVDPPEGVTHEQLIACIEAIIDATEKYRAGLEPWDDWSKDYVER